MCEKSLFRSAATTFLATTSLMLLTAGHANASVLSFANGDFEGYTGDTNSFNSQVPPGWTTTGGTPDTFSADTTMSGFTWTSSSTGGDFLHGIGNQPTWTESAVQEALTGLTVGKVYEISFEQSISNSNWSETGGYWRITFGDETHSSDHMELPAMGVASGWDWQTMNFTAAAETQSLYVSAMSDTDGSRTDIGIDSFYLGNPGENPDNPDNPTTELPEPSGILLLSGALVALGGRRLRKKAAIK